MSRRVYFGGSFAPPHIGHHQILKRLLSEPGVQSVHLVPTGQNPLKPDTHDFNDFERRLLVDAWLGELRREDYAAFGRVTLETHELESKALAYTVDSLRMLRQAHPGAPWVLAIGADLLPQLTRWKSIMDLLADVEAVWVFRRGGYELNPDQVPEELRALCDWRLFPEEIEWISSTEVRELNLHSEKDQAQLSSVLLSDVYQVTARLWQDKQ